MTQGVRRHLLGNVGHLRRGVTGAGLALSGCIHTQELPLAPNMVRLDTQASGLLFASQATNETMRRAAELTLQNSFTHFRFEQASLQQGSQMAGVHSSGSTTAYATTNVTTFGNTGYAATNVMANRSSFSTPIYRPTSSVGVTVIMFHAEEPGAQGAFDAAQVLRQMNG